jgi:uncharacterized membrane protein
MQEGNMAQKGSTVETDLTGQCITEDTPASDQSPPASSTRFQRLLAGSLFQWLIALLLFVEALALNLYRLGQPSIWFDEAFSIELARQPLPRLWQIIFGPEPNMELYYLFLHGWLKLTGFLGLSATEFVVRFPSTIFAALSTVLVFFLGRRFLGLLPGIVAALLYSLNYLELAYAQQTRSYALQLALICLAWYALFRALSSEKNTRRWWITYVVAWTLAIYAHMFSLMILFAQLVALTGILLFPNLWRDSLRASLKPLLVSLLAFVILIIPMLLVSLQGPKTGWLLVPHLPEVLSLLNLLSGGNKKYLLALITLIGIGLFILLLAYGRRWRILAFLRVLPVPGAIKKPGREALPAYQRAFPVAWALFCWLIIPPVASYIVSQGSTRLFSTRYLVTIVPPLCLLAACAVMVLRQRVVQIVVTLVLVVLAVPGAGQYYQSAQVEDWNAATTWLISHYQRNDGLVCYDNTMNQGCQIAVEYYLHTYSDQVRFTPDTPGAFSWEKFGPTDPTTGFEGALDKTALAAFARNHPHLFLIVGRVRDAEAGSRVQATQKWLAEQYHLAGRIVTPTVTILLYDTR